MSWCLKCAVGGSFMVHLDILNTLGGEFVTDAQCVPVNYLIIVSRTGSAGGPALFELWSRSTYTKPL